LTTGPPREAKGPRTPLLYTDPADQKNNNALQSMFPTITS